MDGAIASRSSACGFFSFQKRPLLSQPGIGRTLAAIQIVERRRPIAANRSALPTPECLPQQLRFSSVGLSASLSRQRVSQIRGRLRSIRSTIAANSRAVSLSGLAASTNRLSGVACVYFWVRMRWPKSQASLRQPAS